MEKELGSRLQLQHRGSLLPGASCNIFQSSTGRFQWDPSQLGSPSCHPLTKQLDVHFLQGMGAAELVQLVVDFVEDQGLVVVCGVVPHDVVHWGGRESPQVTTDTCHHVREGVQHWDRGFQDLGSQSHTALPSWQGEACCTPTSAAGITQLPGAAMARCTACSCSTICINR